MLIDSSLVHLLPFLVHRVASCIHGLLCVRPFFSIRGLVIDGGVVVELSDDGLSTADLLFLPLGHLTPSSHSPFLLRLPRPWTIEPHWAQVTLCALLMITVRTRLTCSALLPLSAR